MKNKLLIGFLLSTICYLNLAAQSSSTEANPKWYYIQVKGAGTTANRVLTEIENGDVLGQPLNTSDIDAISKQLWRFEVPQGAASYRIINKYSKKQLTVIFDAASNRRKPAVTDNSPTTWSFPVSTTTGYKYLRIVNEPQEGTAGEVYLSQTLYNSFAYRLVSEAARISDNELFRCMLNEIPVISTDKATIWMYIKNPKTNKYLTDHDRDEIALEIQDNTHAQQWKMIAKENGNVEFVNRFTGNIIASETSFYNFDYCVNLITDPSKNVGWKYNFLSNTTNQYEVFTVAADGVTSYWNATTGGQPSDTYSQGNMANSTYAWIFTWIGNGSGTNLPTVIEDNIRVYSANKRIYVEGCDEYRITNISGLPVRKNIELPFGIYLVTVKGKTTKILVK